MNHDSFIQFRRAVPGVLLTVALYLSGLFVLLTPLAPLYYLLTDRRGAIVRIILPVFVLLLFLYLFLLVPLNNFYQAHPGWSWLIPLPGMSLMPLLSSLAATLFGLLYFLFFVGVAVIVQTILTKPVRPTRALGGAALFFFLAAFLIYAGYALMSGVSPLGFASATIRSAVDEFIALQERAGIPLSQLALLKENVALFVRLWLLFSPSILFCSILFILVLNLVIGKKVFTPFVAEVRREPLNTWSLDFFWVWVVIAAVGALLLNSWFFAKTALMAPAANILLVLMFAYFLQGLAIVSWFFEKKNIGPVFRVMIYSFLVILFQTLGVIVMALGFFDAWFDFRKLSKATPQENK
ncbi:MAG: DUF2232 domain-containing protein [Deltaproteobacteria bacterium]|nr:DUF2232 domain-containing protein [Deltaproteobacteria bacterium]